MATRTSLDGAGSRSGTDGPVQGLADVLQMIANLCRALDRLEQQGDEIRGRLNGLYLMMSANPDQPMCRVGPSDRSSATRAGELSTGSGTTPISGSTCAAAGAPEVLRQAGLVLDGIEPVRDKQYEHDRRANWCRAIDIALTFSDPEDDWHWDQLRRLRAWLRDS